MTGRPLDEMRVGDLLAFLAVLRSESISSAARELGVTPSQVSKAVARLERIWRLRLLSRSSRGATLTEAGRRARPHVEAVIATLRGVGDAREAARLTVAAPSSLVEAFLPTIAACLSGVHVRGLVLPAQLLRADVGENAFDAALMTVDTERLPSAWVSVAVGVLRQGVFASPALAASLGAQPVRASVLREIPFIVPIYTANGRFVGVLDDCPLPLGERVVGHEAETIGLALALAVRTPQVVFGPVVAAHHHLEAGRLVEIQVKGWDTRDTLYLASNGDRVLARDQRAIVRALRASLAATDDLAVDRAGAAGSKRRVPPSPSAASPPSRHH